MTDQDLAAMFEALLADVDEVPYAHQAECDRVVADLLGGAS